MSLAKKRNFFEKIRTQTTLPENSSENFPDSSAMSIDFSTASSASFSRNFWQPWPSYARMIGKQSHTETTNQTQTPRSSYSVRQHNSHDEFLRSEAFALYQEEMEEAFFFLAEFCGDMPEAQAIEDNFIIFLRHRFQEHHYFGTRNELIDSVGKQSLDAFCSMIRNEAIDLATRKTAIWNLSQGLTLCADGAVATLVSAACKLAKAAGGMLGKVWEFKEEIVRSVLQQEIAKQFKDKSTVLAGNEIHYLNTVWNLLADHFGLEKAVDGISMREATTETFLAKCMNRVKAALTPDRLALLIAETCQAQFHDKISARRGQSSWEWTASIQEKFSDALDDIGNEYGLTSEDQLEFNEEGKTSKLSKSDLNIRSFVDFDEDSYTCTLRKVPTLIALDVLRIMSAWNLLEDESYPRNAGEWIDQDGMRAGLFSYGEMTWIARVPARETFGKPVWKSKNIEFGLVTLRDLLQWKAAQGNDRMVPPYSAIEQVLRATNTNRLAEIPALWLRNAQGIKQLLQRLDTDQAKNYLSVNLSDLGTLGAGSSGAERGELFGILFRTGIHRETRKAILTLIEQWYGNPHDKDAEYEVYQALQPEIVSALRLTMQQEEPRGVLMAWYRPLHESGLLPLVGPHIVKLFYIENQGAFWHAVINNHAGSIRAFFALLKEVLKDAQLRSHIEPRLPQLLGEVESKWPLYEILLQPARTEALAAFRIGLRDLLTDSGIAPPLAPGLREMLRKPPGARHRVGDSAMNLDATDLNAMTLEAMHIMLRDRSMWPHIAAYLNRY